MAVSPYRVGHIISFGTSTTGLGCPNAKIPLARLLKLVVSPAPVVWAKLCATFVLHASVAQWFGTAPVLDRKLLVALDLTGVFLVGVSLRHSSGSANPLITAARLLLVVYGRTPP